MTSSTRTRRPLVIVALLAQVSCQPALHIAQLCCRASCPSSFALALVGVFACDMVARHKIKNARLPEVPADIFLVSGEKVLSVVPVHRSVHATLGIMADPGPNIPLRLFWAQDGKTATLAFDHNVMVKNLRAYTNDKLGNNSGDSLHACSVCGAPLNRGELHCEAMNGFGLYDWAPTPALVEAWGGAVAARLKKLSEDMLAWTPPLEVCLICAASKAHLLHVLYADPWAQELDHYCEMIGMPRWGRAWCAALNRVSEQVEAEEGRTWEHLSNDTDSLEFPRYTWRPNFLNTEWRLMRTGIHW